MLAKASISDLFLFKFSTNFFGQKWLNDQCNVVVGDNSFLEAVKVLKGEREVNETMRMKIRRSVFDTMWSFEFQNQSEIFQ